MGERPVYIYALVDPRTDQVRYIGKTKDTNSRLLAHCNHLQLYDSTARTRWLRELRELSLNPSLLVLTTTTEADWPAEEQRQIELHVAMGCSLTNQRLGPVRTTYAPKSGATSIEERFWFHVKKLDGPDPCWEWQARKKPNGYGIFGDIHGHCVHAHRFAYQLVNGPIPRGMWVRHRCDNRACVRPTHLILGTPQDNHDDMCKRSRAATGDRNGMRTHPERNGKRLHPESSARGARNGNARLTDQERIKILSAYASGTNRADLARRYAVNWSTINSLVKGRFWNPTDAPSTFTPTRTWSTKGKLTEERKRQIRDAVSTGLSFRRIAAQFDVGVSTVSLLARSSD